MTVPRLAGKKSPPFCIIIATSSSGSSVVSRFVFVVVAAVLVVWILVDTAEAPVPPVSRSKNIERRPAVNHKSNAHDRKSPQSEQFSLRNHRTDNATTSRGKIGEQKPEHAIVGRSHWDPSMAQSNSSNICVTPQCLQQAAQRLARAFPDRSLHLSQWCFPRPSTDQTLANVQQERKQPQQQYDAKHNIDSDDIHRYQEGLLLVKMPKAASSTMAGVAYRIVHRHGCDLRRVETEHLLAHDYYSQRNPQASVLLTSVRHPDPWIMSYVFWISVTNPGVTDIEEHWLLERVRRFANPFGRIRNGQGGFQTQFASLNEVPKFSAWMPDQPTLVQDPQRVETVVRELLHGYDFVVVTERMTESLVALALLLGLDLGDVLVTSSKVSSSSGQGPSNASKPTSYFYKQLEQKCLPIIAPFTPPLVQSYLESDEWHALMYGDYLLHAAANLSLDWTIDQVIGRDRFHAAMAKFQRLQRLEEDQCAKNAVYFPCSSTGLEQLQMAQQNCYLRDFGCGYQCIDHMLSQMPNEDQTV